MEFNLIVNDVENIEVFHAFSTSVVMNNVSSWMMGLVGSNDKIEDNQPKVGKEHVRD